MTHSSFLFSQSSTTKLFNLKSSIAACSFLIALALSGCQSQMIADKPTADVSTDNPMINTQADNETLTLDYAKDIKTALAQQDYEALIPYIHPTRGVRFSMYAYIQPESDKVFSREQYAQYLNESDIRFTWGQKDGTGKLYITPLPDYLKDWVQADYFDTKTATINHTSATGNSINNIDKIYQNLDYVEFYNPGVDPQFGGLDWRALRLVFDDYQGKRYLVAIISDQWTT